VLLPGSFVCIPARTHKRRNRTRGAEIVRRKPKDAAEALIRPRKSLMVTASEIRGPGGRLGSGFLFQMTPVQDKNNAKGLAARAREKK